VQCAYALCLHSLTARTHAQAAQQPVVGDAAAALMPAALAADAAPVAGPGAGFALGAFRPKLLTVLAEGYGLAELRRDVLAGLSVGVIALSLSAALGIASESTPAAGLYTAVAAGFVVSALGGSRVAIGGPTAAFIPVLIAVEHQYGAEGLVTCTVMAGGMLVVMGLAGLGTFITKIPRPVITGFTAGIATFIFSTQLKDFLGLHLPAGAKVPPGFVEKLGYLAQHLDTAHAPSLALAVGCLALLKAYPAAWAKSVPPQIVAVVAGTLVVAALEAGGVHTGIDTIGTRFGVDAIPSGLPLPHLALPSVEVVEGLLSPAFTIALLAAIESLLCAVVADGMIDDKHDSNTELIAQGLANIASASIGGLPATGALARTAANIRSGGRSPVSGMVHALTVLAIMLVAAPAAAYIPLPALSAVLVLVALNMGEWKNFAALPGLPAGEAVVYLTAFMLTVLTDVTVAVEAGLALSALLYLKRITDATDAAPPHLALPAGAPLALPAPAVATLQLSGALLFGATDKLEAAVARAAGSAATRVLLLDCEHIIAVDATGLEALQEAQHKLHKAGKRLVLSGLRQQPLAALATAGLMGACGCLACTPAARWLAHAAAASPSQRAWATRTWCAARRRAQRARSRCWSPRRRQAATAMARPSRSRQSEPLRQRVSAKLQLTWMHTLQNEAQPCSATVTGAGGYADRARAACRPHARRHV
jgi:SulP family sulfate permease